MGVIKENLQSDLGCKRVKGCAPTMTHVHTFFVSSKNEVLFFLIFVTCLLENVVD